MARHKNGSRRMKIDKSFSKLQLGDPDSDLLGKKVVIVGGTGGLGRALSLYMATHGAKVLVVGQTFRDHNIPGIEFIQSDLSLMSEAELIAQLLPAETLDMLIFTTGIFANPIREETPEGLERDMAVSYLNRLLILRSISTRLGKSNTNKPRVFVMGYPGSGHKGLTGDLNSEQAYKAMDAHMNTVAGNEILVLDSATRYKNFSIFGLNPGLIKTNIRSNFLGNKKFLSRVIETLIGILSPSAEQYAQNITQLLISPELDSHSGALFDRNCRRLKPSNGIDDTTHMNAFLKESFVLLGKAISNMPENASTN